MRGVKIIPLLNYSTNNVTHVSYSAGDKLTCEGHSPSTSYVHYFLEFSDNTKTIRNLEPPRTECNDFSIVEIPMYICQRTFFVQNKCYITVWFNYSIINLYKRDVWSTMIDSLTSTPTLYIIIMKTHLFLSFYTNTHFFLTFHYVQ